MMHLNDGQLRAYLDDQLQELERREFERHLADCAACRARLARQTRQVQDIQQMLAFLSANDGAREIPDRVPPRQALANFRIRILAEKEIPMMNKIIQRTFHSRLVWAGLVVFVMLAVGLSIPSGRSFASQFLDLFRVQQVTVLPIDPTGFTLLNGDSIMGRQIGQLLASSIKVEQSAGKPQPAAGVNQASQEAGFSVRLPSAPAPDQLVVRGREAFNFVIDISRAQALLNEAGRSDLVLPKSLDGESIAVNIPAGVGAAYGDCPSLASSDEGLGLNANGSHGRRYADCLLFAELPSPTVDSPPNVDLGQLAQLGLQFTGMSAEEAKAYSQSVDWTTTLVVPIPKNAATYKQIPVDGVTGTLIQRPADDAPQFALIWVKDGVVYAIGGLGSDSARAIQLANSIP